MRDQLLIQIILGDIAANEDYGIVMKKWRELFNVTQSRVAKELKIKQSVISDYENNRRKSPGIDFLRRFTTALISIACRESRNEYETVKESLNIQSERKIFFNGEFNKELSNSGVVKMFKAVQVIAPKEQYNFKEYLFFSDNLSKVLTKHPSTKLFESLKSIKNAVFIFSNVKSGNVPLILLKLLSRTNKLELPKMIVFQTNKFRISSLARRIAKNSNISLCVTGLSNEEIIKLLYINLDDAVNV